MKQRKHKKKKSYTYPYKDIKIKHREAASRHLTRNNWLQLQSVSAQYILVCIKTFYHKLVYITELLNCSQLTNKHSVQSSEKLSEKHNEIAIYECEAGIWPTNSEVCFLVSWIGRKVLGAVCQVPQKVFGTPQMFCRVVVDTGFRAYVIPRSRQHALARFPRSVSTGIPSMMMPTASGSRQTYICILLIFKSSWTLLSVFPCMRHKQNNKWQQRTIFKSL